MSITFGWWVLLVPVGGTYIYHKTKLTISLKLTLLIKSEYTAKEKTLLHRLGINWEECQGVEHKSSQYFLEICIIYEQMMLFKWCNWWLKVKDFELGTNVFIFYDLSMLLTQIQMLPSYIWCSVSKNVTLCGNRVIVDIIS